MKDPDEDEQPTIELTRKILGALAVTPAEVTAGQKGVDFEITYTPTEELEQGDVIEVRLPAWDADPSTSALDPPMPFNYTTSITTL